jgi:hypothetical protein
MSWPSFELETSQQREGRWVLTDLEGKGRRICDNPTRILAGGAYALTRAQIKLRQMVLDSVQSIHSKRNYAKALDDLFAFCQPTSLSRAADGVSDDYGPSRALDHQCPHVSRAQLVGEARRNGMIGSEEAANLTDIPNVRQQGTRLGTWLTREQAKELLAVPDRSTPMSGCTQFTQFPEFCCLTSFAALKSRNSPRLVHLKTGLALMQRHEIGLLLH